MNAKAVQVSIGDELLERIDRDDEAREIGRSAFIRLAVTAYLEARERARIDEKIFAAYGSQEPAELDEVDDLIGRQAWPAR